MTRKSHDRHMISDWLAGCCTGMPFAFCYSSRTRLSQQEHDIYNWFNIFKKFAKKTCLTMKELTLLAIFAQPRSNNFVLQILVQWQMSSWQLWLPHWLAAVLIPTDSQKPVQRNYVTNREEIYLWLSSGLPISQLPSRNRSLFDKIPYLLNF